MRRRLKVVAGGLSLGVLLALWVAGPLMPSGMSLQNRAFVWAIVLGGPLMGTTWGMAYPVIGLGWIGLLLVPAHPSHPHWFTGLVTSAGLALWFFAGFVAVMVAVWGG